MTVSNPEHRYTLDGIVRSYIDGNEWVLEISHKSETVWDGPYKSIEKWYLIGRYSTIEALDEAIMNICFG
jgi:hypothetical protein